MIRSRLAFWCMLVLCLSATAALAFDGQKVTEGPLTLVVEPIDTVTTYDQAHEARVTLTNADQAELAVELELCGLVDECRPVGAAHATLRVPGKGRAEAAFRFLCAKGCLSAHYPLRVRAAFSLAKYPVG